jgi:hypothetical protein
LQGTPASLVINYALPTNNNFHIGAYRAGGACELRFTGDIDEVRIFNRALSAAEIQTIFLSTP